MKVPNFKLINSAVFFLIIWGTQCLVSSEKSVSFEQHVQVQQELSQLIATYIQENLPEMTNFKMHSVYTKPPKKGLMEAYFNYSFTTKVTQSDQLATTELEGVAVLRKLKDQPQQEWALEKIIIEDEAISFTDPIVITPSKDGAKEAAVPAVKETPVAKPAPVAPQPTTPVQPEAEKTPETH